VGPTRVPRTGGIVPHTIYATAQNEWDTVGAGEIVGDELMDGEAVGAGETVGLAVMVGEPVG
jgi:hypothetical protein